MSKKLKRSRYAFFINKDDGSVIAYSSLSGAIIAFREITYIDRLNQLLSQPEIEFDEKNDIISVLYNKKLFVDVDADEDLLVRCLYEEGVIRNSTLDIMLIVTRQCNFRCVYCGQPHLDRKMEKETYDSVIAFVRNQLLLRGYSNVRVTFFGGEPLVEYNNIIWFLEKLKSMLDTDFPGIHMESGMSTNGYLLTPNHFDKLVSLNCSFYQISVDGMSYTHDKTRPLVGGQPTWQTIINNLSYMVTTTALFKVALRTNFNFDVADSLQEFYKYVSEKLNDKRIGIYFETIKDQGNSETPQLLGEIESLFINVEIVGMLKEYALSCNNVTSRSLPCSRVCYASKPNYFVFDDQGYLLKCSFDLDNETNNLGRIEDDGTVEINESLYSKWVYSDYLSSNKCKKCSALPLCFGKRCPKARMAYGEMDCDLDVVKCEIEEMIKKYY